MPTSRTPRSTSARAASPSSATKSSENASRSHRRPFGVLKSTRSAPRGTAAGSSPSTTTQGPTSTSSDSVSTLGPPSTKWSGASTCVPLWTPRSSRLRFTTSPFAIEHTRSSRTSGSPGYVIIPGRTGTLTSMIRTRLSAIEPRTRYTL